MKSILLYFSTIIVLSSFNYQHSENYDFTNKKPELKITENINTAYVTVYKNSDFTGESMILTKDWNLTMSNNDYLKWNDKVNSIRVPEGWSIRIYKQSDYWGSTYLDLADDWSCDDYSGWSNQISSIKVFPPSNQSSYSNNHGNNNARVKIYKTDNYNGESKVIQTNWNLTVSHDDYMKWNDKVNSIIVPEGWSVRIFKQSDFWGTSYLDLTDNWSSNDYYGWTNQISSIQVSPPSNQNSQNNNNYNQMAYVKVYKNNTFSGESMIIKNDWNPDISNNDYVKWNNKVNSIRIPEGWSVRIYKQADFWGTSYIDLAGDWESSSYTNWNNQISSIKIIHKPNACTCNLRSGVTVYKSQNYSAEGKIISSDWNLNYSNDDYMKWNDKVNSIRVPEGWSIRIYKQSDFWGTSYLDIADDWSSSDYPNWSNQISSIKVISKPDVCPIH